MKVESGELIRNSEFGIRSLCAESESTSNPQFSILNSRFSISQSIIISKNKLADAVYEFAIVNKDLSKCALPGQFLHIRCSSEHILRRPISISFVRGDQVFFVVEIRGEGTRLLCEKNVGERLDALGPLGKGFTLPEGNVLLIGGGIGVAPLLYAAKMLRGKGSAILGFRDKGKVILEDSFDNLCQRVVVTTDDGSYGTHGNIIEPLEALIKKSNYNAVLTCGPRPMMASVAKLCREHGIACEVSLEEYMGCGVGACFVCACKTIASGTEQMSRVCVDGPVFDAHEVVFGE